MLNRHAQRYSRRRLHNGLHEPRGYRDLALTPLCTIREHKSLQNRLEREFLLAAAAGSTTSPFSDLMNNVWSLPGEPQYGNFLVVFGVDVHDTLGEPLCCILQGTRGVVPHILSTRLWILDQDSPVQIGGEGSQYRAGFCLIGTVHLHPSCGFCKSNSLQNYDA